MSQKTVELLTYWGIVAAILIGGLIAIKILLMLTAHALKKTSADPMLYKFFISALKVVLYIVLFIVILSYLDVATAPIITVLGASGAAVALAMRDSLSNVAGGITIMLTKPFARGDYIDIGGTSGIVESIDLLLTTMKTYDNKVVTVPNGMVTTSVLINYTREGLRRVDCSFGIGYDDDINKAKDILLAVAQSNENIKSEPGPFVGVAQLSENSVLLDFRVWCRTSDYWDIKYFIEENVKMAFHEAGMGMPGMRMDVHLKKK